MSIEEAKNRVLKMIDRNRVIETACDLVNIPSPTGYEKECADYIIERYKSLGMKVIPQEFDEDRANAVGIIKGDGSGPSLMLNGHMDTSYVGDEQYLPDKPGYHPSAVIDDDWIYGLGIYNMKGGLAAFICAAEAVRKAGVELRGDLVVTCVGGEIEKSQVDRYQGQLYRGGGCGTWYAMTHGALADFAVVGEPTGLSLMRAHGGYVWTRIVLVGSPRHSIFGKKESNTINNMLKVAQRVQEWGDDYEQRTHAHGMGAKVTLSAIEGGWPHRCSRVPIYCTLYVDTRLMPGQNPIIVQREIEQLVADMRKEDADLAKLQVDTNVFMNQWASEISPEEIIFQETDKAYQEVMGTEPDVTAFPYASDAAELNAYGIPALNCGPAGTTRVLASGTHYHGAQSDWNPDEGEHCNIDELVNATKIYASLILNVCMKTRAELGLEEK